MSIEHLDLLHSELPELFQDRDLVPGWHDDLIVVAVRDPDKVTAEDTAAIQGRPPDEEAGLLEDGALELIEPGSPVPVMDPTIVQVLGGGHAGSPIPYTHQPFMPPPDCLAFYLPFHYYHPDWWGVYLLFEGVIWLAGEILRRSGSRVSERRALEAARMFLYYHEAFHHKTECFATRLELTHRRPFYKTGFERLYQRTLGTDDCLEEGLANAGALKDCGKRIGDPRVDESLSSYVNDNPPGYRRGNEFRSDLPNVRCSFAEENQRICLPHIPSKNPGLWQTAPHSFHGIADIRSRVNYVIPRTSLIADRLRFRPCLSPNKLIVKLRALVGMELVREGKRHQIWRTASGNVFEIPRHPRDLGRGLLRKILSEAGLHMGIDQFLAT